MLLENNKISVSVMCVTYNHERYIARALDSFLAQEVDFSYEIIIADDCSTDNTLNILQSYEAKFPEIIRVLRTNKNLGAIENGKRAMSAGRGKYFSMCDGDDFFIDTKKLQISYDFMESDESLSMVFTPALVVDENTAKENIRNRYPQHDINLINLNWVLKKGGGFFPTCTSFYRSSVFLNLPKWFYLHSTGDYPQAILAILKGRIGYIDEVTGCYWKNQNSLSNKFYNDKSIGKEAVFNKYKKNLLFINNIFNDGVMNNTIMRNLVAKEDYVYHAKLLNLGFLMDALKGIFDIRYSYFLKYKIILKALYSITFGKYFFKKNNSGIPLNIKPISGFKDFKDFKERH